MIGYIQKATEVAGVYDQQGYCNLELALARNSWKIRVIKLLEGIQKPSIQQIQQRLKEVCDLGASHECSN